MNFLLMLFISIVKCDLKAKIIEQLEDPVLLNTIAELLLVKLENKSIQSEISVYGIFAFGYKFMSHKL